MHSNHHHQLSSPPPSTGKPPLPPPPHQSQPPLSVSIPSHSDPPIQPNDSPHSPLRSESDATSASQTAIVAVEKYYSPLTSPLPVTPPPPSSSPPTVDPTTQDNSLHHIISFNRREEAPPQTAVIKRVGFRDLKSGGGVGGGGGGGGGGVLSKVGLGFRVLEVVVCLVSFSVMASDKTQGWSGDSFDRYNEYRFCLTVTIMGFVYSGFQAFDLAYHMSSGKHVITHHLRYQFDFIADQILAYLLISASSAAATRVNDWVLNWGKDEFTEKVSASISMAFIAFACFAITSLISGCNLCNRDIS